MEIEKTNDGQRKNEQMRLLNEQEVAQMLNCTVSALRRWRREGRGPKFTKIYRLVRYRDCDVAYFIERHVFQPNIQTIQERGN
jgi:predicted DNA-binding transcriptional regulator AlpA